MNSPTQPQMAEVLPKELLKNARVLPHRNDILPLIPKQKTFVEVGVAIGDFSELILHECDVAKFIAIDLFTLHDRPQMWNGLIGRVLQGQQHIDYYRQRFAKFIEQGRFEVMQGDSLDCLAQLPDHSADIFYVDANHTYPSVLAELSLIQRKISPEGWIILNDYIMSDWIINPPFNYGVVQATNEFMIGNGWEMLYLALNPAMYCDVVLRRATSGAR